MLKRLFPLAAATAFLALVIDVSSSYPPQAIAKPSPGVVIQKVFSGTQTLNGSTLTYPEGTPEMRLFRVEIPAGGSIPLHTHPAPMLVHVQDINSGDLLNTRVQPDGSEVSSVFKPGQVFLEGSSEPHYVANRGTTPTIIWVYVASVEGLPTTEWMKSTTPGR